MGACDARDEEKARAAPDAEEGDARKVCEKRASMVLDDEDMMAFDVWLVDAGVRYRDGRRGGDQPGRWLASKKLKTSKDLANFPSKASAPSGADFSLQFVRSKKVSFKIFQKNGPRSFLTISDTTERGVVCSGTPFARYRLNLTACARHCIALNHTSCWAFSQCLGQAVMACKGVSDQRVS